MKEGDLEILWHVSEDWPLRMRAFSDPLQSMVEFGFLLARVNRRRRSFGSFKGHTLQKWPHYEFRGLDEWNSTCSIYSSTSNRSARFMDLYLRDPKDSLRIDASDHRYNMYFVLHRINFDNDDRSKTSATLRRKHSASQAQQTTHLHEREYLSSDASFCVAWDIRQGVDGRCLHMFWNSENPVSINNDFVFELWRISRQCSLRFRESHRNLSVANWPRKICHFRELIITKKRSLRSWHDWLWDMKRRSVLEQYTGNHPLAPAICGMSGSSFVIMAWFAVHFNHLR